MFCLVIGFGTLACGIAYLLMGYEILVGLVQILLGLLSIGLVVVWKHSANKKKIVASGSSKDATNNELGEK